MDPTQIYEYVSEGAAWLGVGGLTYLGLILGCQTSGSWPFRKKIKSQEELESIVKEEAEKLELDFTKIKAVYGGTSSSPSCRATKEGYIIEMKKDGFQSTRNFVRHELYHILKDCDRGNPTFFYYCFIAEPRATLYETFGIKL